jgi:ABC-type multidrug transport system ATPase subunit
MKVVAKSIGKKFHPKWIFKNLHFTADPEQALAITGKNGSGKSTLLKLIAGYITPSTGHINWWIDNNDITSPDLFCHISMASPYIELIEEFSLTEMIRFHGRFKPYQQDLSIESVVEISGLGASRHKPIRQFSSGMKQRLKLLLAITCHSELLLLDEPCSNLDADSVKWYHDLLLKFTDNRCIVVASNNKADEYPGIKHFVVL